MGNDRTTGTRGRMEGGLPSLRFLEKIRQQALHQRPGLRFVRQREGSCKLELDKILQGIVVEKQILANQQHSNIESEMGEIILNRAQLMNRQLFRRDAVHELEQVQNVLPAFFIGLQESIVALPVIAISGRHHKQWTKSIQAGNGPGFAILGKVVDTHDELAVRQD